LVIGFIENLQIVITKTTNYKTENLWRAEEQGQQEKRETTLKHILPRCRNLEIVVVIRKPS
jgi:hypothetical protein